MKVKYTDGKIGDVDITAEGIVGIATGKKLDTMFIETPEQLMDVQDFTDDSIGIQSAIEPTDSYVLLDNRAAPVFIHSAISGLVYYRDDSIVVVNALDMVVDRKYLEEHHPEYLV